MSDKDIKKRYYKKIEELKHLTDNNTEFWYARDLQIDLDYSSWDKFKRVILKAITACENSGQAPNNHFSKVEKMVQLGSGSQREIKDYQLYRYACNHFVQNGDPSKPFIANGQTYFAIQTRCQELADNVAFQRLKEEEKRLFLRNEMKKHNKKTGGSSSAGRCEVQPRFRYLSESRLQSALWRTGRQGDSCEELGGTMPEELPTPDEDLKKLEKRVHKQLGENHE